MAFNSTQCISCKEPSKRNVGKYFGSDEKGRYSGPMYECDNETCNIYIERKKLLKSSNTSSGTSRRGNTK